MKTNMAESLFRSIQAHTSAAKVPVLKKGQILAGKILELYPNQQAAVKIAGNELVAKLEASLNKGGSYWFQVEGVEPSLKLKVIGADDTSKSQQNLTKLLLHMGIKTTREKNQILQTMLENRVPIKKEQLLQAIKLIDEVGIKGIDTGILKEMLYREMPFNKAIYQAFKSRSNEQLTKQIKNVLAEMESMENRPPLSEQLTRKLSQFLFRPTIREDSVQPTNNLLFQTVKGETLEVNNIPTDSVKFTSIEKGTPKPHSELLRLMNDQLPVATDIKKQLIQFSNLLLKTQESTLMREETQIYNNLSQKFTENGILQKIGAQIGMVVPATYQQVTELGESQQENLAKAVNMLTARQLSPASEMLLMEELQKLQASSPSLFEARDYFLSKLKTNNSYMGLNYEADVVSQLSGRENNVIELSLKSLLMQTENGTAMLNKTEKMELLFHTLNGIQLASIQENENFLQVSIQIPGDDHGVKEDVFLDIEGRKNKDGEIDSSFCRILFYLKLGNIEETVIDMNVVNRNVNLTIFNDVATKEVFDKFKSSLKAGLDKLDYTLVSLKTKEISRDNKTEFPQQGSRTFTSIKGVDFRI